MGMAQELAIRYPRHLLLQDAERGAMIDYSRYMASSQWLNLRSEVKYRARSRCEYCLIRQMYAVHHRTYERLGHENLNDLMAVCGLCHQMIHGLHQPEEFICRKCSPVANKDTGHGMTSSWEFYLENSSKIHDVIDDHERRIYWKKWKQNHPKSEEIMEELATYFKQKKEDPNP